VSFTRVPGGPEAKGLTARPTGPPSDFDIEAARGRGRYVRIAYPREERHHVYPKTFKPYFKALPRDINIDEFCVELTWGFHSAIHSKGWNKEWEEWIDKHKGAPRPEVEAFRDDMMGRYLISRPFVPFKD
jgi:hypothetical protein